MIFKLIPLSDFVLEQNNLGEFKNGIEDIRKYAEFLQQDLKLSMFLPCDDNEKPLKSESQEYEKALEKIIFIDVKFDIVKGQGGARFYYVGKTQIFNLSQDKTYLYWHHYTIESLLSDLNDDIYINF